MSSGSGAAVHTAQAGQQSIVDPGAVGTMMKALRQAAQEQGHPLSDALLRMMLEQLIGSEGAMPGMNSTLAGTNNIGAAQVPGGKDNLAAFKKNYPKMGGFAHFDSNPGKNKGDPSIPYLGWYWIAPSPLDAARYWLAQWWGKALLTQNPPDETAYSTILYKGVYFGGTIGGDPHHNGKDDHGNPSADAQAAYDGNIASYAKRMTAVQSFVSSRMQSETGDDPSKVTFDPSKFQSLDKRKITQALFDSAKAGHAGSAWAPILPATWADMQKSNGVVWNNGTGPGAVGSGGASPSPLLLAGVAVVVAALGAAWLAARAKAA
jgi:hypothetical protein